MAILTNPVPTNPEYRQQMAEIANVKGYLRDARKFVAETPKGSEEHKFWCREVQRLTLLNLRLVGELSKLRK